MPSKSLVVVDVPSSPLDLRSLLFGFIVVCLLLALVCGFLEESWTRCSVPHTTLPPSNSPPRPLRSEGSASDIGNRRRLKRSSSL